MPSDPNCDPLHGCAVRPVWCWAKQPILLVPARVREEERTIDWVAIFCHELAHWRRLDHLASLAGELLVCVLPWNPLAWLARTRLAQFAEARLR